MTDTAGAGQGGPVRSEPPVLTTDRLVLRPFRPEDADPVRRLAGDVAVARNTANIPHPYSLQEAESWIGSLPDAFDRGAAVTLAVIRDGTLVGAIGLVLDLDHDRAELGYWIGRPHWGRGYATEAATALVGWAFEALGLQRIHARHFRRNPQSGRVLEKLGMSHEGTLRRHRKKWGDYLDMECYGLLRDEWSRRGSE